MQKTSFSLRREAVRIYFKRNGVWAVSLVLLIQILKPKNWVKELRKLNLFDRTEAKNDSIDLLELSSSIYTERLCVSNLKVDDVADVFTLLQAKEDDWGLFRELINGAMFYSVRKNGQEELVGLIGIHKMKTATEQEEQFELGYRVHKDHQGQGLATEAALSIKDHLFSHTEICKLVSLIEPI